MVDDHRATLDTAYYPNTHVDRNYDKMASEYYLPQDVARKIRYADIKALRELAKKEKL